MLLSVPSSISSEPEDGPRLSLAKKPMPKPDRELKEGKSDEEVSTKSEVFFQIARDCRLQRLIAKQWGPVLSEGVEGLFKGLRSLQCCYSISGSVDPTRATLLLDLFLPPAELLSTEP